MSMGSSTILMLKGPLSLPATSNIASANRDSQTVEMLGRYRGDGHTVALTPDRAIVGLRPDWVRVREPNESYSWRLLCRQLIIANKAKTCQKDH